MKLILLFFIEILLINLHFLLSRFISVSELHFNPFIIIFVFLILKTDDEMLMPSVLLTGVLADCFFSKSIGPFLSIFLISSLLLKNLKNVVYKDHVLTHVIFAFCFSLICVFIVYFVGGEVAFRAPIIISIYNAILMPVFYYLFEMIKLERLLKAY